jgi:hypothetical protein
MSYNSSAIERAFTSTYVPSKGGTVRKRGLIGRMLDAMTAARMRQAEAEVARYLADTGGKFTDEAEREIERRFLSTPSRF